MARACTATNKSPAATTLASSTGMSRAAYAESISVPSPGRWNAHRSSTTAPPSRAPSCAAITTEDGGRRRGQRMHHPHAPG